MCAEMLKQIDEPLFPTITVDSSPTTPVPVPTPPKLYRCGGRNVKHSDLSPGGWSLTHAETMCLGDTQVDGEASPRSALGLVSHEPEPKKSALPSTQNEKLMDGTTSQSPLRVSSNESEPMESALPSTQNEKQMDGTTPDSSLASPPHSSVPPAQPDPRISTQDCYFYYLPLLSYILYG